VGDFNPLLQQSLFAAQPTAYPFSNKQNMAMAEKIGLSSIPYAPQKAAKLGVGTDA
jgi:hypothetical protein